MEPQKNKIELFSRIQLLRKKYIVLFSLCVLLVSVPLTIALFHKNQANQSHANLTATLSLKTQTSQPMVNTPFTIQILVNPGENLISQVSFRVLYDHTLFTLQTIDINTTAFPVALQKDVQTGTAIVSIGTDTTKSIRTPTTVATITLLPIAPSTGTALTFDTGQTSAYGLSSQGSQVNDDVLQSLEPLPLTITGSATTASVPTCTPRPPCLDATPRCLIAETADMCPASGSATLANATAIALSITLPGIGTSTSDNHVPLHSTRQAQLSLYTASNTLVTTLSTTLTYQTATSSGAFPKGTFSGTFPLPNTVTSGTYFGKIKLPSTLRKQIDAPIQITDGNTTTLSDSIPLISGDLHNTNMLDLSSYNEVAETCFYTADDAKAGNPKCADFTNADINDDGLIDETDLNLLLRNLSQRTGD